MAIIQWYPGHIAKAEKQLKEQLKKVDVVLEVRDARIPIASHHPDVSKWIGEKSKILILNRVDMISDSLRQEWLIWFKKNGEKPFFTNAKNGEGVKAIAKASQSAGIQVNQRRQSRGMLPRPVRAVVIGFPNVGKSALINRLLNRKVVASERRAGVTKQLHWVRISNELELLDAPGIIPVKLQNQDNAIKLAICEDIGEASYDNQRIAAAFIDLLVNLNSDNSLVTRYDLDALDMTGEEFIYNLAEKNYQGDKEKAARQILNDFRKGYLGGLALEFPPVNT
jgi:ribosome biogenesis GTPase A